MPTEEEGGLELVRWGTRFADVATERRYLAWQIEEAIPINRAAHLASGVTWFVSAALVLLLGPPGSGPYAAANLALAVYCFVGMWVVQAPSLRRWAQAYMAFGNCAAGSVVVVWAAHYGQIKIAILAACIVTFAAFVIFRLRPWQAAIAVAPYMIYSGALVVHTAGSHAMPTFWALVLLLALAVTYEIGLLTSFVVDRMSRQTFRNGLIVAAQKETIARERARSEMLLKQELAHQVAERSRELGKLLARIDGSHVSGKLMPGDRFDARYTVVRGLGAGGMGAVYEVRRNTDQERLALKIITGKVSGALAARFAREAEIGARVRHPNVVSIVDVGIGPGGAPFLALELADGGSLEEKRARFGDRDWAVPVLRQVADGLAALHDAGVVHRDLKPANILFFGPDERAPTAKISDFGISRFGVLEADEQADPDAATVEQSDGAPGGQGLTATGVLLGTPFYMAPEAARGGGTLQASADVFAFGILGCELLTGRAPFTMPPVYLALAGEEPAAPSIDHAALDTNLAEALFACLSVDASARPAMRQVAELLAGAQLAADQPGDELAAAST